MMPPPGGMETVEERQLGRVAAAAVTPRPVWSSGRAYIVTAIAGVIGLGAIWRFPYLAGEHGGGAFLLAYLVCMVIVATPLAAVDSGAGQLLRRAPVGLFRAVASGDGSGRGAFGRLGGWFGWVVVGVTVALMSYYFVVTGWTFGYALTPYAGEVPGFETFTAGMGGYASLWLLLAVGALVYLVLLRGNAAIERASRVLLPLLGIIVVGLAAYAQTLDGASEARAFYLQIDRDHLLDGATWRAAAGQAFYQMGIGQGFLIAYGSYAPGGLNLVRATGIIGAANASVAIVAGLLIFPIVFTFGIAPDAGTQLAFTAIPEVLDEMPAGVLIGIAFFTLLFVAAFTSCIGGAMVAIATVRDELGVGARRAATLVVLVIVVMGVPSALSFTPVELELGGKPFLDAVDEFTGSGVIIAAGLIGSGLIAWRLAMPRLALSMHAGRRRVGPVVLHGWWVIVAARVLPLAGVVLIGWMLLT